MACAAATSFVPAYISCRLAPWSLIAILPFRIYRWCSFDRRAAGNKALLFAAAHQPPGCHPGRAQREPVSIEPIAPWVPALRDADASLGRDDNKDCRNH